MDPSLRRYLASLAAAGVRWVPRGRPAAAAVGAAVGAGSGAQVSATGARPPTAAPRPTAPPAQAAPGALAGAPQPAPQPPPASRPADPAAALAAVAAEVVDCQACKLCSGRQRAVPGEGHPDARVLFIGEGPGAEEDRTGRPFVGPAGQLLDDIIRKGMGLSRAEVFIANVVKCRPPANRVPEPDEVAACRGFLERQIAAVAPAVICTLGATATRALLDTDAPMGRLRGRQQMLGGIPVIPTYHPAYLLRNPAAKRPTWQDIQKVMELAGLR